MSPSTAASELRYRRLFEAARDGILIVDPETRKIVDVNPFLVEFLGYTHEEFIGKELFEIGLLKDEAASQKAFRELQEVGFIRYDDLPLKTREGRQVDVEFVSNIYVEGDQRIIQCNIRDITSRKTTEKALHETKEELSRHAAKLEEIVKARTAELRVSNTQLETFVNTVAHDLRGPLRAMQGFSSILLADHAANQNEQGKTYLGFINTAAKSMGLLVSDLLVFCHVDQQKIQLESVSLEKVIQSALKACGTEIRESKAIIQSFPPWPLVWAHAATLQQVLVNLIGNATKFVGTEAPQVIIRAEERPEDIVRVWVEDNGIGIAAEFQERIFKVFQRLHSTEYPGTGIGLAIVQRGVERMGGRIGVVSELGAGSKFWIELAKATPASPSLTKD